MRNVHTFVKNQFEQATVDGDGVECITCQHGTNEKSCFHLLKQAQLAKFMFVDSKFPLWRTEQQWQTWKSRPEVRKVQEVVLALLLVARNENPQLEFNTSCDLNFGVRAPLKFPTQGFSLGEVYFFYYKLCVGIGAVRRKPFGEKQYTLTLSKETPTGIGKEERTLTGEEWKNVLLPEIVTGAFEVIASLGDLVFDSFYEGSFDEEWGQERISYLPGLKTKVRDEILSEGSHLVQEYEALCGEQLADHLTVPMLALLKEEEPPSLSRISLGALLTRLEVGNALRDKEVVMQCEQELLCRAKKSMGARAMKLRVFDHVLSKAALQTLSFIAIASQTEYLQPEEEGVSVGDIGHNS